MNDERRKQSSPVWITVIVLLIAVPTLYILSTGPAIWLRNHGQITQAQLLTVYAPVGWMDRNVPFFSPMLENYVRLWASPPPPPT